jgi:transcriptional regulator with XRE-family HTH domain
MPNYNSIEQQILIAFGLRLKAFRIEKQLSQEELAEATNLHRTYIGSAERGERNVSLLNMTKIANALNVSIAYLVSDDN